MLPLFVYYFSCKFNFQKQESLLKGTLSFLNSKKKDN